MEKKKLNFIESLSIVVGMVIGSGVFLKTGVVLQAASTPFLSIMAWVVGGIITIACALTIAEISVAIPKTGGLYAHLEELYSSKYSFLLGWVQSIITYPASIAALAIAFSTYLSVFIKMDQFMFNLSAIVAVFTLLLVNVISTKFGGRVQTVATIGKVIPLFIIILMGCLNLTQGNLEYFNVEYTSLNFGVAILGTLWAYEGWISVSNLAEEVENPTKNLPRVIVFGLLITIIIYVLFNAAIFLIMTPEQILASTTPAADAAYLLFGKGGSLLIAGGIMVSVFGALNGFIMTSARVPFAMANNNRFPLSKVFMKKHNTFQTPANALLMQCILSVVYILSGTFNTLTDLLVFVVWIFFTLGVVGIFKLRKMYNTSTYGYKVPLYPITPIIGALGGVYIIVSTIISRPIESLIGIGVTLLGIPVYYLIERKRNKNEVS